MVVAAPTRELRPARSEEGQVPFIQQQKCLPITMDTLNSVPIHLAHVVKSLLQKLTTVMTGD